MAQCWKILQNIIYRVVLKIQGRSKLTPQNKYKCQI